MKILSKIIIAFCFTALLIAAIVILEQGINSNNSKAVYVDDHVINTPSKSLEDGVFDGFERVMSLNADFFNEDGRSIEKYYNNRAYPGAPPIIPHTVENQGNIGANNCLQCHKNGGYVPNFNAYAPITPHPDYISCKQCHVPVNTEEYFKKSEWQKPMPTSLNNRALATSPPVIPHEIKMHENCLSCHLGPSAVKEIKVSHPERSNCLQCHAKGAKSSIIKEWKRPNN
ncbi:MAG: nitrate reductase cytochrome c-type subunit [Bacteroidia bacterium]